LPKPESLTRDPENRLLSRASVRRLAAEEVRDALLAVSGQLDAELGGSLLKVKNRGYFFDHTSKDLTDYTSRRRSLYLPVVRNNVYDHSSCSTSDRDSHGRSNDDNHRPRCSCSTTILSCRRRLTSRPATANRTTMTG
jgi:hypothetical protein